ncbi:MAG TPA: glycosyltransferase family 2 protein [Bryobacteraceae bacterium]|nr:glycosyltransferase family 2 protein [Bryobacteraceae bacterium]
MDSLDPPLVSIVTPSYNTAKYLAETIESVLSQDYPRIEYIVVDGGSTDETREILERYKDRLRYVSAADLGPSDAAYQGFRQVQGEILAWLNADDSYLPGAVRKAVDYLQSHPDVDVVYGEGWWIDENGGIISRYPTLPFDPKVLERDCFICQPAAFLRASAYRRCELDPNVNRSFDYDLWIRMAKAGIRFASIPDYLANSRMHSGAKTIYEREVVFQASMNLLKRHYGYIPLSWIFGYTAYRLDHRDQFFQPLRYSAWKYVASLPVGLWYNRRKPLRFLGEWLAKGGRELVRKTSPST